MDQNPTEINTLPEIKKPIKKRTAIAIGVAACMLFTSCSAEAPKPTSAIVETVDKNEYDSGWAEYDESITAIILQDGARLRSNPGVTSANEPPNIIKTLELGEGKTLRIELPKGTFVRTNNDGDWYLIPEDVNNPEIKNDGDAWVNQAKATPERDNDK